MVYFNEYKKELHVSIPGKLNNELLNFLIREDGQEDLLFGFWFPSEGAQRNTALVHSFLKPIEGDRNVHGNVSFNYQYFKRACDRVIIPDQCEPLIPIQSEPLFRTKVNHLLK